MLESACAARGDDRDANRFSYSPGHLQIVTLFGAIGVLAGEQDFACAQVLHLYRPVDNVHPCGFVASFDDHFQSGQRAVGWVLPSIDGNYHFVSAELQGGTSYQLGVSNSGRIHRKLSCTELKQGFHVINVPDSPAYGKGDSGFLGYLLDPFEPGSSVFHRGGDVEENQLVSTLTAICLRRLRRVSSISQVLEFHSFDHTRVLHVQARYNPHNIHYVSPSQSNALCYAIVAVSATLLTPVLT